MISSTQMIKNNIMVLDHADYFSKKLFSKDNLIAYHKFKSENCICKLQTNDGFICFTPISILEEDLI